MIFGCKTYLKNKKKQKKMAGKVYDFEISFKTKLHL